MKQPTATTTLGEHWGERVAQRRNDLGLSQAQLADLCGITQQTVSKIEKGVMIPHDKLKLRIAQRTGIRPELLFPWPENLAGVA